MANCDDIRNVVGRMQWKCTNIFRKLFLPSRVVITPDNIARISLSVSIFLFKQIFQTNQDSMNIKNTPGTLLQKLINLNPGMGK